jgi:hypothetical protein
MAIAVNTETPFGQDAQTAKAWGAEFVEVIAGSVALTTLETSSAFAHGMATTPDFVIATATAVGAISSWVTAAITATTVTLSTGNTLESKVISYVVGDLA